MTLIEVIDTARHLLSEPLDSTRVFPDNSSGFWADSAFIEYFNMIQEEVQNEIIQTYEDYFLTQSFLSITNGCAGYILPSAAIKIRRVEDTRASGNPLEIFPVTINNRDGVANNYFGSSIVNNGGYYLRGTEIVLTTTPAFTDASAIQLHYVKKMARVSASTGTSEIPPEHHGTLVWGIVKMAQYQQQADSTFATAEYEKRVNKLVKYAENRQIQRPRRVKSVYGDTD